MRPPRLATFHPSHMTPQRDRDELPTFKNTYCPAFLLEVGGLS